MSSTQTVLNLTLGPTEPTNFTELVTGKIAFDPFYTFFTIIVVANFGKID